ncbi:hypothetical protein [Planctomicrobium piriforme]|uniref:RNA polymerase subunit sigma-24 n=1 Tax=Planctomicrobium piriforme TaxID=1576369 RepID=A0A1I3SE22_9PLAN|nr:hypothetical protein [Planctomicrobium piriforme]SFJ55859.1 hypothetical protein SAMN05421753_12384 [Planctomicrobium piriforme]
MRSHAVPAFFGLMGKPCQAARSFVLNGRMALCFAAFISINFIVSGTVCMAKDAHNLTRLGGQMTPDQKDSLEKRVENNPNDVESRTKLLGYYFINGRRDVDVKTAKQRHILWLIENAPESEVLGLPYSHLDNILEPEGYDRAKQAWLKAIQQSSAQTSVLNNASRFFLQADRGLSEELLLKGQALDGKDPQWPEMLGQLYALELMSLPAGDARKVTAEKAFRQYELAYDLSEEMRRDALLPDLATTAFEAGLNNDAKKFATKMLENDAAGWNHGNRIHHGNLILGRIALSEENVAEAKSRLLLAGKTNGSPQLNSFGPNMQLAKELLERKEADVVLEYFELCKKFWKSPHQKLDQWTADVKSNRVPDFGPNLAY